MLHMISHDWFLQAMLKIWWIGSFVGLDKNLKRIVQQLFDQKLQLNFRIQPSFYFIYHIQSPPEHKMFCLIASSLIIQFLMQNVEC